MKAKLIIMAALCATAFTANAQTEKGKKLIGGGISFITQTAEGYTKHKTTSLTIGPKIGFFIAENFVIGSSLNYAYGKNDPVTSLYFDGSNYQTGSVSGNLSSSYGIAPFARYYVGILDNFKFYGQLNVGADFGTQETIDAQSNENTKTSDYQSYAANLNYGVAFFANKKLGVELSFPLMGYMSQKIESVDPGSLDSAFSVFSFSAITSPTVGVNFHF